MKKRIILIVAIVILSYCYIVVEPAMAAKKRVVKAAAGAATAATGSSRGVGAWVRLRSDRQALLINFSSFGNLQSGSYELTYQANGVGQGAGGSIILGDTDTKTLLFGTCSSFVCTYHRNIVDAKLRITSVLKNGKKVIKSYKIKV